MQRKTTSIRQFSNIHFFFGSCIALAAMMSMPVPSFGESPGGNDERAPVSNEAETKTAPRHSLVLTSFLAGVFNNLGAMYGMSLNHRTRLYHSDNEAFSQNFFQMGIVEELTPSNSVTSASMLVAPTSFFDVELRYSLAAEWFFIDVDSVNEDYTASNITDRLDDQSDRTKWGQGISVAPALQMEFSITEDTGIRFRNVGTFHWWFFGGAIYYNHITSMLVADGLNYKNEAMLFYYFPLGPQNQVECMLGLSSEFLYTSDNGRSQNALGVMGIFSGLPFFGKANAFALIHVGAWLHNDYQDGTFIPKTPMEALLVYGFELDFLN
ncbi:MAG: hypothetical protein JXR76_32790 [Deltaproteobacteria bacterium]|nr:hypothetical protein [Deltaproteobacteria bacterium]